MKQPVAAACRSRPVALDISGAAMARSRTIFLEDRTGRSGQRTRQAISAWIIVGLLILMNVIGLVLDRAVMIAP
jgi:hypothetical protein